MTGAMKTVIVLALFLYATTQEIGERCTLKNGTMGTCENVMKCTSVQEELRRRILPTLCGFKGNVSTVCCGDSIRISEKKCREYLALDTPYQPDLVFILGGGGVDAQPKEFPHLALLGYHNTNSNTIEYNCGGSLISDQFILTAGHCLESRDLGPVSAVRIGDLDTATDEDDAEPQDFKVIERYPHPAYNFRSFYNDIALIKLDHPAKFTTYVKPACLNAEEEIRRTDLIATGWGALYYGGDMHNRLQKLLMTHLPKKNCLPTYKPQPRLRNGFDEELQICGGNLDKAVDTCQGDSGGPLQFQIQDEPPVHRVVGVTSFGINCNLVPGIYTKVSKYVTWIESVVWPNNIML